MKKCPFCAEEIQDAAIKCRYCGSFLSVAPPAQSSASPVQPQEPAQAPTPAAQAPTPAAQAPTPAAQAPTPAAQAPEPAAPAAGPPHLSQVAGPAAGERKLERKVLYHGSPAWRAYLKAYFLVALATALIAPGLGWLGRSMKVSTMANVLMVVIPLAVGVITLVVITLYRRSQIVRVTTSNIETERGILSKKIEVLELWRCRDVRYKQSLFDRILRIAHVEIFTADVTTPQLEIVGLPASRELFENIRDSIEIQRQARNVYGVIQ